MVEFLKRPGFFPSDTRAKPTRINGIYRVSSQARCGTCGSEVTIRQAKERTGPIGVGVEIHCPRCGTVPPKILGTVTG